MYVAGNKKCRTIAKEQTNEEWNRNRSTGNKCLAKIVVVSWKSSFVCKTNSPARVSTWHEIKFPPFLEAVGKIAASRVFRPPSHISPSTHFGFAGVRGEGISIQRGFLVWISSARFCFRLSGREHFVIRFKSFECPHWLGVNVYSVHFGARNRERDGKESTVPTFH